MLLGTITEKYPDFRPHVDGYTFVKIQPAADMYWQSPQDQWDVRSFPAVVSPWPMAWLEWRQPNVIQAGGARHNIAPGRQVDLAVSVEARRLQAGGWKMFLACFSGDGYLAGVPLELDSTGRVQDDKLQWGITPDGDRVFGGTMSRLSTPAYLALVYLYPALMALSLCHCRNVQVEEHQTPPGLLRKYRRRGYWPIYRYYTLVITSMRRRLREGGPQGTSLQQALHLCQGHFKDFREGPGLFGQHHGVYWWDLQARGNAARGEIRKDYEIRP